MQPTNRGWSARDRPSEHIRSARDAGPDEEELGRAKALAVRRLWSLADDREDLVRFWYQRGLVGAQHPRELLEEMIRDVTARQVQDVAEGIVLDTVFFLHNPPSGAPGLR